MDPLIVLDDTEVRVLGCLIEKELATPEYYPLSLNALVNACNQKTNRDPVVAYDEQTAQAALDGLIQKGLVWKSVAGRVPKYEERFTAARNLVPRESAVLCELFLRGPQTAGELRGRTARMVHFADLEEVHATLDHLEAEGYVRLLPRMPGHKESRYVHLLCPEPEEAAETPPAAVQSRPQDPDERLEKIETQLAELRRDLDHLKEMFQTFKKQFE
jgi:uncharacterized protein YceH (UPF0502 family)